MNERIDNLPATGKAFQTVVSFEPCKQLALLAWASLLLEIIWFISAKFMYKEVQKLSRKHFALIIIAQEAPRKRLWANA